MRPVRLIKCDHLKYKYISVTQNETRMVVRVLLPVSENSYALNGQLILSTESLKWKTLYVNGQYFQVVGEGIFDLNNPLHKSWYQANANICFCVNPAFAQGNLAIIPMHLYATDGEKCPEWASRNGYEVIAQLYPWSESDPITECPCSFAVDVKGKCYTNISESRFRTVDLNWMQREDRSDFLLLHYTLTAEKKEKHILFTLTCCDNDGNVAPISGTYRAECTMGYLPVQEFKVFEGKGHFYWVPLMIPFSGKVNISVKDMQHFTCISQPLSVGTPL